MDSVADGCSGIHTTQPSTPPSTCSELYSKGQKRMKIFEETFKLSPIYSKHLQDKNRQNNVIDHSDPFAVANWEEGINSAKFGTVTKDIEALLARRRERMKPCLMTSPILRQVCMNSSSKNEASLVNHPIAVLDDDAVRDPSAAQPIVIIDSDDEEPGNRRPFQTFQDIVSNKASENEASLENHPIAVLDDDAVHDSSAGQSIVIIDSDDEEPGHQRPFQTLQDIVLNKPSDEFQMKHFLEGDYAQGHTLKDGDASVADESDSRNDKKSVHVDEKVESRKDNSVRDDEEDQSRKGKMNIHVAEEDECMKDKGQYVVVDGSMEIKESRKDKTNIHVAQGDECLKDTGEYVGEGSSMEIEESSKDKTNMHLAKGDECLKDKGEYVGVNDSMEIEETNIHVTEEDDRIKDKGEYVGVDGSTEIEESSKKSDINFDGLADIWKEMNVALECSKDTSVQLISNECMRDGGEECDHSFLLKDDLGYVCRICGVISRGIETIIEYQYAKSTRSTRTYYREGHTTKNEEGSEVHLGKGVSGQDFSVVEIYAHPRHKKQMKPHQVEGFNFLLSNLMTENPGGCILAHAPGSGKTFMLISFIQSFMTKYPSARPLVVLPRGILPTWKKEFKRWQVEDLPLHDFYSVKADSRSQQLEVLKQWAEERSILFMGYKQFSSIVCNNDTSNISTKCQEILLTYPSILILDEGHTPRNQDTDVLTSLEKVQTPRKVVLSGTLYQNHVREVFTILNLVRPKFLRLETSKSVKKRILSRVPISSRKNLLKKCTDNEFYEMVEHTLIKVDNFRQKVTVIEDLREMTSKVLHYYKGDFLDELPGLVDFSVFLNLSPKQKKEISALKKLANKFKISSDGGVIYVHPELKSLAKNTTVRERVDEGKIDEMLNKLDMQDGVKAKFYLNLLNLCESSGEKLLVFGQYLLPLKFLERLTMRIKGWNRGREMFMITGDSDSEFRELSMDCFNNSPDARVFFGSIKACGEGISLVGASRIIILDVHLNPSVTRQAIGRAFRPGQTRKVYTYRLVAASAPEEEDHNTCFRKESIAKMWFEWNEYCGHNDFEMETADVSNCGDQFLEMSRLNEDVAALYRR